MSEGEFRNRVLVGIASITVLGGAVLAFLQPSRGSNPASEELGSQPALMALHGELAPTIPSIGRDSAGETTRIAEPVEASAVPDPLRETEEQLAQQINDSLEGFLYVNHVLDQLIVFASLPVDSKADLEYEDDDGIAYRILGTPEDTSAHFLVGRELVERNGNEYRYVQMEIQMDSEAAPTFFQDSLRFGPRIHMSVTYDERGNPESFAMIMGRAVAFKQSKALGIDAFQGRFTTGAGYRADRDNLQNPISETYGLINGEPAKAAAFQGISPLRGDIVADYERLRALVAKLMEHRQSVDGSR